MRIFFPKFGPERNTIEGVSVSCSDLPGQQRYIRMQKRDKSYMANWVKNVRDRPIDSTGDGGRPGKKIFYKISPYYWITENSANLILNSKGPISFIAKVLIKGQRIGNVRGIFGMSMLHGQDPGEVIYKLIQMNSKMETEFFRDVKKSRVPLKKVPLRSSGVLPQTRVHPSRVERRFANPMLNPKHKPDKDARIIYPRLGNCSEHLRSLISKAKKGETGWHFVIEMAVKEKCYPEIKRIVSIKPDVVNALAYWDVSEGNLEILKYAINKGGNFGENPDTVSYLASKHSDRLILEYLRTLHERYGVDWDIVMDEAAENNHVHGVQIASQAGGKYWSPVIYSGIEHNNLEMFELGFNGLKSTAQYTDILHALIDASKEGHIELIKYAVNKNKNHFDLKQLYRILLENQTDNVKRVIDYLKSKFSDISYPTDIVHTPTLVPDDLVPNDDSEDSASESGDDSTFMPPRLSRFNLDSDSDYSDYSDYSDSDSD